MGPLDSFRMVTRKAKYLMGGGNFPLHPPHSDLQEGEGALEVGLYKLLPNEVQRTSKVLVGQHTCRGPGSSCLILHALLYNVFSLWLFV